MVVVREKKENIIIQKNIRNKNKKITSYAQKWPEFEDEWGQMS